MSSLPQTQQPVVVYPNAVTKQSSSHSNGSFGTVFIVLAVIVVVSAIACFLGRLCNRRVNHPKPHHGVRPAKESKHPREKDHQRDARPREKDVEFGFDGARPPKERDIEFGFDKRVPTAKVASTGGTKGYKIPSGNGEMNGEMKHARDGDPRGFA